MNWANPWWYQVSHGRKDKNCPHEGAFGFPKTENNWSIRPTHSRAGSDNCFRTCCPSVLTFQNLAKQTKNAQDKWSKVKNPHKPGKNLLPDNKPVQDRSHQWTTQPTHSLCWQWLSFDFEVLGRTDWRTDVRTLCENSDHYRPGLWSASWIKKGSLAILVIHFTPSVAYLQHFWSKTYKRPGKNLFTW